MGLVLTVDDGAWRCVPAFSTFQFDSNVCLQGGEPAPMNLKCRGDHMSFFEGEKKCCPAIESKLPGGRSCPSLGKSSGAADLLHIARLAPST